MRTRLTVATLAAATLLLSACSSGSTDDSSSDAGSGDGITIGIKFDQPGLGLKEGNTYSGFDVDVARYVADKLGYSEDQITWMESPSSQRETLLENGQVDMIFATYSITDERDQKVDFAGPYFVAGQDLLVAVDNTDITGPDTLGGKLLCSVTGSTSATRIKDNYAEDVQLQEFDGYSECVEALAAGSIDAVTTDDIILAGFAAQPAFAGSLKVVGNPFSEENYGVGIPTGSELCQPIQDALTEMFDDGTWQELLDKNVGDADYTPNADLNPPTLRECA
ncbi:glutamate ABC transporter substrate-binding protein [Actinotalea sp. M2MS4P-6]|uniref:glutamate ABC transporter substrate-binding protein n=1 Tax=Actinotalea sp. M2MS4P-6 TaxID=2983762 RepID=UPI0021E511A4|nr:glutamate ABC transporter substrate-binding protein [Actinotalea sp. M2MS4P-6]MCV2393462.1 glutamate ABC transporter substrate-binding protein [Actinotalea sp. M2MS4P-6]